MTWLWPIVTGVTFIDVWTLPHVAFWVVAGSVFWPFREWVPKGTALLCCLVVAFLWEWFEKWAEFLWPERWLNPEGWLNSWVSDPLTCIIGFLGVWWMLDRWARKRQ